MILDNICFYVQDSISSSSLKLEQYVTTDCMLPDKGGITVATNLPPQECRLTHFSKGDVLVANIRPYLKKIWQADKEGGSSNDVLVFRPKQQYSSEYLYAILLQDSFFDYVMKAPKGCKMPRGDKNHIMHFPIVDIEHKKFVGKILSSIDRKIAVNRKMNEKLEAMAKQIYDYWFVQFDFPNEEGKPYKSSGGKMVWNEKLKREIPEGWKDESLDSLLEQISDSINVNNKGNLPYLPIDTIPMNKLVTEKMCPTEDAQSSLILFEKNDILIGAMRVYFHRVIISPCKGITRTTCFVLRSKDEIYTMFNLLLCNQDATIKYATQNSQGTTMPYAVWENGLASMPVFIPPHDIALNFNNNVTSIIDKLRNNAKEISRLESLRDYLLPILMNGQVKINK